MWSRLFPSISILRNRHIGEAVGFTSSLAATILFIAGKGNFINIVTDHPDDEPFILKTPLTIILTMSAILLSTYFGSKVGSKLDERTGGYTFFDKRTTDEESQIEYYVPTDKLNEDISLFEAIVKGAQLYCEEGIQAEISLNQDMNPDQRTRFNELRRML